MNDTEFSAEDHRMVGEHIYDGVHWPAMFPPSALDRVKQMEFRADDIIVAAYPRSGTTWMSVIVRLLLNDGDFLPEQPWAPMLEGCRHAYNTPELLHAMPSPRTFKTHLQKYFFDRALSANKGKFIIVIRNIKDTLLAFYHMYKQAPALGGFRGTLSQFLGLHAERRLCSGDWYDFNLGWWQERDNPRVLIVSYEEMSADVSHVIRRVAQLLDKPLTEQLLQVILDQISLEKMRANPHISKHATRKGIVGDWRNCYSPEDAKMIDDEFNARVNDDSFIRKFTLAAS